MGLYNFFIRKPSKPKPWFLNPSLTVPIIAGIIIGLSSLVWNSMAADIKDVQEKVEAVQKEKATNQDVKEALQELKNQNKESNKAIKETNEAIKNNQIAIKELLIRQEMMAPSNIRVGPSPSTVTNNNEVTKVKENETKNIIKKVEEKIISPELFEKYMSMKQELKKKYKEYLIKNGYDVSHLPD